MQKLADVSLRRPIFGAMIILGLVVIGGASYFRLGVDRFPSMDLPNINVRTELPGAAPEEMETTITQPIEEVVNTADGISELRSFSEAGRSSVNVTFDLNRDIETAQQDVRDRVSTVTRKLPRDVYPPIVSKTNSDQSPIMTIGLAADRSLRELTELADKVVKPQIERSAGVGNVTLQGGLSRAINIWVDADRLAAYKMDIGAIREALVRQNTSTTGGNVTNGHSEATIVTMGRVVNPRDFNDVVIDTIDGSPIRIRDIGYAEDGTKEQRSLARLNGAPTVTLEVRRQIGANTVSVIEGVKAQLALVQAQLPGDVKIEVLRDQSAYIYEALHEINVHLIVGSLLACLVVLLFMKSWRSTIIAGVAIPCSLIASFGMMRALNFTLNSVTMLALMLMVGIVIDDAIVVLENIFRFIEEKKLPAVAAARHATQEIGLAVMATTLSLAVIFIPVSFMSSISGRFLYQFGITAAVAVMVSLLVSFTLTPLMSARLLDKEARKHSEKEAAASRTGFYRYIDIGYSHALAFSMRHRAAVVIVAIAVMISSVPLYKMVHQEYLPGSADEGEFEMQVNAPEGMSLPAMDEAMRAVEKEVQTAPGVHVVLSSIGTNNSGYAGSVNQANLYVKLIPHEERVLSVTRFLRALVSGSPSNAFKGNISQQAIMAEIRGRVRKYRDLRIGIRNVQTINLGSGSAADLFFNFRGPDLEKLYGYAESLRQHASEYNLVDADVNIRLDKPEFQVRVDRERAADLGVDVDRVASALRLMVGGEQQVSLYHDPAINFDYDVDIRLSEAQRKDPDTISRLYIQGQNNNLVRLDNLVKIKNVKIASQIGRLDRQRQVSFRANVPPGYGLADRMEVVRAAIAKFNMPAEYNIVISGQGRELERTFIEFIFAFMLSVVFMYMILASQFESLVHPLTILLSLPLSIPFALFSMWFMGSTLNLYSALGMLVLFGVVKKNAILQIDHMNGLRAQGLERSSAILQANRDRLRPILMTTLALVAGMLPMLLASGPGAEEKRTIAVVVIGGQSLSLLLTLLVTPVAYSIFDDLAHAFRKNVKVSAKQAAAL
jgi:hydrophobic/amphiphilic exporter-1 (mainly G- bacteria), HAE1 family